MNEEWKDCIFNYMRYKDDASKEACPCKLLQKIDNQFWKIRYYILVRDKQTKEIVDVIVKDTVTTVSSIENRGQ